MALIVPLDVGEPGEPIDPHDYAPRVAEALGVRHAFRHAVSSAVAVHEILERGLPARALLKLADVVDIPKAALLPALGVSLRTFMRLKADPSGRLAPEQSGRLWQFAQVLTKAEDVLGDRARAVEWLQKPAMALERRRPIDLLTTAIGAQLVDDVIERMRYGVYQ